MDLIDATALDRLREFGGDKLLRGMIELFVKNAPKKVTDARAALDASDAPSLKAALHGLKSSAGQLGAATVHQACAAGEELADKGDVAACVPHVVAIERDLPLACNALLTLRPAAA
jgi:HPt (histidine-containing phosphotransfer) domain-containing protein